MDRPEARAYYDFEDLVLWQMHLSEVPLEDALHSAGGFFVSPDAYIVISGDSVFAGFGRPGRLVACERATGRTRWSATADTCHGVVYRDGVLAWLRDGELAILDPSDGTSLWSQPLDSSGSSCHPLLEIASGRVFVGSSNGRLHALDASNGNQVWSQQVVPPHAFPDGFLDIGDGKRLWLERSAEPSIIETRPAVLDDRIVVGTYARSVVAYHIGTGRRAWQWQIDGPALGAVLPYGSNVVLHTTNRVYCLRAWDGWVLWQWDFPDEEIHESFACSDRLVFLTTSSGRDYDRHGVAKHDSHSHRTVGLNAGGPRIRLAGAPRTARLLCEPATGRLYQVSNEGLSIIDPDTGGRLHHINLDHGRLERGQQLAVAVTAEAIYLLTQAFSRTVTTTLYALRHP